MFDKIGDLDTKASDVRHNFQVDRIRPADLLYLSFLVPKGMFAPVYFHGRQTVYVRKAQARNTHCEPKGQAGALLQDSPTNYDGFRRRPALVQSDAPLKRGMSSPVINRAGSWAYKNRRLDHRVNVRLSLRSQP